MRIDKEELLRRLRISEQYNSDIPAWVINTIEKMPDADRDCETCIHHTENGCTVWECSYMPDNSSGMLDAISVISKNQGDKA